MLEKGCPISLDRATYDRRIEGALIGRVLLAGELLAVRQTLAAARRVHSVLRKDASRWPELHTIAADIDPCTALFDAIGTALDQDGNVRDEASPKLKKTRRDLRVVSDRLRRQLESILNRGGSRDHLQDSLITQRNGRFVIPVKSEFRSRVPGVVHDTSDSGATIFVEPMAAVEGGNRLRELQVEELKEVERVLRELTSFVAGDAEALEETIDALARLDFCFAKAALAASMRAIQPRFLESERPNASFPLARHPLIDADEIVPIDIHIGDAHQQVLITGPNTGGKTVALKTMGLLVLMAQAGLHVPADEDSALSVFDAVFADIGDEQSIEQSLSTFSGHMTNIIEILGLATSQSLVLLDELGAGTDPQEGAALAGALLEHFLNAQITTMASTHYSELKLYAHSTPGVANASVQFDIETLRPTYELVIGLPGRSNALAIAERLGLRKTIIEAARSGLDLSDVTMEELLGEIHRSRQEAREERLQAAEAREKADAWAARLEAGVRDIDKERLDIMNEARRQADQELRAARKALSRLLKRAERVQAQAAAGPKTDQELARSNEEFESLSDQTSQQLDALEQILDESTSEPVRQRAAPENPRELVPGDTIKLLDFGQEAEVIKVQGPRIEVSMGQLRMSVDRKDVQWLRAAPSVEPAATKGASGASRHSASQPAGGERGIEVDLRGLRVEEGLEQLDRHLDQALLLGLPWVRIIHGHGTGAMKKAVREALRRYKHVKKHRAGERGEGGDGATVAYLAD